MSKEVYIAYYFKVEPLQPAVDILIAELGTVGFESFVETEDGLEAYIQQDDWQDDILRSITILQNSEFSIQYRKEIIEQVNWNAEWEKNFDPIVISDNCAVRAPFHRPFNVKYEIIIEPKMSFGTGHHETTHMMLEFLLEHQLTNQKVLDMGCGTAVLAILAEMRGAAQIDAIDNDNWCVENSKENADRNNCERIKVKLGDASLLSSENKYDTIIANINRNILLYDMAVYHASLKKGGVLLLSGFYSEDLKLLINAGNNLGLTFVQNKERNNWIAAKFVN